MKLREPEKMNIIGTFHMVVQANAGVDVEEFLRKNNEYIAEPTNGDGVVIIMLPKSFSLLQQGVKTPIWESEEAPQEEPTTNSTEETTVHECRTCGDKECGALAGSCAKWKPRQ